jgi:hypothetical protein
LPGEIEFHHHAVGIADEQLHRLVARDDRFTELEAGVRERLFRRLQIRRVKGHVVHVARPVVVRLAFLALYQVDHRPIAEIHPVAGGRERRAIPGAEPQALVEVSRPLDVRRSRVDVLECGNRHG